MSLSKPADLSELTASDARSGLDGLLSSLSGTDLNTIAELGLEAVPSAAVFLRSDCNQVIQMLKTEILQRQIRRRQ